MWCRGGEDNGRTVVAQKHEARTLLLHSHLNGERELHRHDVERQWDLEGRGFQLQAPVFLGSFSFLFHYAYRRNICYWDHCENLHHNAEKWILS